MSVCEEGMYVCISKECMYVCTYNCLARPKAQTAGSFSLIYKGSLNLLNEYINFQNGAPKFKKGVVGLFIF